MRLCFLSLVLLLFCCGADYVNIWGNATTDQQRCEAEARYMASRNIRSHVGPLIGRFEGIGWGSSPNCKTCTPRGRMSLTGDASVRCPNGMWIRVRSWR